jgi:hypothetical protein
MHLMLEFLPLHFILKFKLGLELDFVNAKQNRKEKKRERKYRKETPSPYWAKCVGRPNAVRGHCALQAGICP